MQWQNLLRQTVAATSACYEDAVDLTVMSCPDNNALVSWLQRMHTQNHISNNVISAEVFHTALECTKLEAAEAAGGSGVAGESDWPCPALLPDAQVLRQGVTKSDCRFRSLDLQKEEEQEPVCRTERSL